MAIFSIPDDKGKITQPNVGDSQGNIYMSYGLDLETNKGHVGVSAQVKKLITDVDNIEFSGYAGSIGAYSGDLFAVSDKAFRASTSDPLGTWTESIDGSEPDSGNTIMDSVFFDSLFLVSEATNIKAWNGSTWSSWWTGTLGAAALTSGQRHLMEVGSDGNLYVVDLGNKLYKVTPQGTESLSGDGTLDFSATNYLFTALVSNSTRLWVGTSDNNEEEAVILEWDMSATSNTVNRIHKMGAKKVNCIAIWNDTPIAVLSNGKVKYFNGSSFVEFEKSIEFPVPDGFEVDEGFIHPNGWAIIDDLPHFLVSGRVDNSGIVTVNDGVKNTGYQMASGIWCLDPAIGLYHRFALGTGAVTQEDYGKIAIPYVGALYSLQNTDSKFLASYEYYLDDETDTRSVLVYHDASNSQPSRGYLMTPFLYGLRDMWKKVELFKKTLVANEKINVFYRTDKEEALAKSGVWSSTSKLNITGVSLGIEAGNVALIKMGPGSGQLLRVQEANESSTVTVVTFTETNSFVTVGDKCGADFLNFKFMGSVTDLTQDYHAFDIPNMARRRKTQFLFEFQQAANNTMELDFAIIST